ncbi:unnamed protein product [Lampetra planeri]
MGQAKTARAEQVKGYGRDSEGQHGDDGEDSSGRRVKGREIEGQGRENDMTELGREDTARMTKVERGFGERAEGRQGSEGHARAADEKRMQRMEREVGGGDADAEKEEEVWMRSADVGGEVDGASGEEQKAAAASLTAQLSLRRHLTRSLLHHHHPGPRPPVLHGLTIRRFQFN